MNKSMWNSEAVKAYETGQGVVLVEKPYPHYEPVAWGMENRDGDILDVITPTEHARLEGGYKVPLYRHPVEQTKSLQRALDALGPTPPECCGCQAEWQIAIDAIKEALADHAIGEVQRLGQEIQPEDL